MIPGYATPTATADYFRTHEQIARNEISTTGLISSQAGFGCYRVSAGVAHHEAALREALGSGINSAPTTLTGALNRWWGRCWQT